METIYRAKGKDIGLEFLFKYDLEGHLRQFEVVEGSLNAKQMKWLFGMGNFPACESIMRSVWMKEKAYKDKFEIDLSPADLGFDVLWKAYNYKVARQDAEKAYNKLNQADKIKCFLSLKQYEKYLERTKISKAHLSRYINARYFENEY